MAELKSTISTVFNIRSGEALPLSLLLLHSFAHGLSLVFLETPANTLFLSKFGAETLPYVYIATACVSAALGFGYSKLEARLAPTKLLTLTLVGLLILTGLLYLALALNDSKWLTMGLMVWKDVWYILAGIEFWALAGFLFNVRQGKRLFGLVGTGEVLAGIIGGLSVPLIIRFTGPLNLLLIAIFGMLASLAILIYTLRLAADRFTPAEDQGETGKDARPFHELFKERYLLLFFGVSVLSYMGYYFIDYIFYDQVESAFPDENQLASFFGIFYAVLSLFDLVSSGLISGRMLTRYGLTFGLMTLPVADALAGGGAVLSMWAGAAGLFLWLVVLTKLFDEVFRSSVQGNAFRILYQPLPAGRRLRIQAIRESIVEPMAVGMAGTLLLLLTVGADLSALQLMYAVLALIAGCIVLGVLLRREYTTVLMKALTRKRIRSRELTLDDQSSINIVLKGLESPNSTVVIYCLRVLEENENPTLETHLLRLLAHPKPLVREYVLSRVEHLRLTAAVGAVIERLGAEDTPAIRGTVLRTLCALQEVEAFKHVQRFIAHPDPDVKKGVLVGLLRSGGIDGVLLAGQHLNRLLASSEANERQLTARILGEVGIFNFYQPLLILMRDPVLEVRKSALEAAGRVRNLNLVPVLLESLSDPRVRGAAYSALIQFGQDLLPTLKDAFVKGTNQRELRNIIVRLCGRIGGSKGKALLTSFLEFPDESVRDHVLAALVMCKYRAEGEDLGRIEKLLRHEVEDAAWTLAALEDLGDDAATSCLRQALLHQVDKNRDRALLLLSFTYNSESILQAKFNLGGGSVERRASALEVLDNLLPQSIKQHVFPLLDELTSAERAARLESIFPQRHATRNERLREIIQRPDVQEAVWTKMCALFAVGTGRLTECADCTLGALGDPDPFVRETAAWALSETDREAYERRLAVS